MRSDMKKNIRRLLYLTTIFAVLLMSAMPSYAVYADDGTEEDAPPEAPPITTPTETPAEDLPAALPEQEAPANEGEPESPQPEMEAVDEPQSEEAASPDESSPADDPVEVPEILEQVPEGTDLVVLNQEGTPEPLASQEAAEILVKGDPIWCPEGNAPEALTNGCSPSYTTFGDLISELSNITSTYSGNGVIWVATSYAGNDDAGIIFNGTNGNLTNLGDVSVVGGWSGISGNTIIDPSSPSVLDERLVFRNWTGAISVSNLAIQNTTQNSPNLSSLRIITDGNISLNNVTVSGSVDGAGAFLNNCLDVGAGCTGTGDLSVLDSEFSNNFNNGLTIRSSGEILIEDVTAESNGRHGINLNTYNEAGANVTIKDTTVTFNIENGIQANDVGGDLTLKGVTASNNGFEGILINNTQGNITGSNITTNENNNEGIEIDATRGDISLSNVNANDSINHEGVDIHDTDGNLTLSSVTTENNNLEGIEVVNVDGSLGLYCVKSSFNDGDGIFIEVDHNFTIKCSQSTNNVGDGLQINLAPSAQLLSFTAAENGGLDINYNASFTTVTEKQVDCSPKTTKPKSKPDHDDGLYTKLYCLPGEIKVALYDTYGDKIEFDNLCGYEAGVFDPNSWAYPETIPGGGDDYITSLQNKMLEEIPNLELNTEYGMSGVLAQILDELAFMLPDKYSYASAFFTAVLDEGEYMDPLPEESGLTVRFRVPEWLDPGEELTILWWDGATWVDLGGEYSEDGYYFQVTTEETGVFVLATFESES
jgi:hypothetical protein